MCRDNQLAVSIQAGEGECPVLKDNRVLVKFALGGIPRAPRGRFKRSSESACWRLVGGTCYGSSIARATRERDQRQGVCRKWLLFRSMTIKANWRSVAR